MRGRGAGLAAVGRVKRVGWLMEERGEGGESCWRKGKEGRLVDGGQGGESCWRKGKEGRMVDGGEGVG